MGSDSRSINNATTNAYLKSPYSTLIPGFIPVGVTTICFLTVTQALGYSSRFTFPEIIILVGFHLATCRFKEGIDVSWN